MNRIRRYLKYNNLFILCLELIHRLVNKIYTLLILGNTNNIIDYTSKIYGIKNIKIYKNFHSGKFLRLEAINHYEQKNYHPKIVIKNNVSINDFVHIGCTNYIEIGNNVLIASKVYITDHNHGFYSGNQQSSPLKAPSDRVLTSNAKVIIEDNVWIGEFVSILPNVRIGKGSIIGANSVVCKDIPEYCIAVGSPAKVIKKFNFNTEKWETI